MRLTESNVQSVMGVYPERYFEVFPKIFELLVDPDLEEMALYCYVVAFRDILHDDERPDGHMGFNTFGEACFEGGFVKAMMTITQDTRTDKWHGLSSYFALDAFWHFMRTGTSDERRALLRQMLDHNALQICLAKIEHPLAIHRQVTVNILRCLASESYLGETLSSRQTSDIMVKMCHHILRGPEFYAQQLGDPVLTWQSFLCFGKFDHPRDKARTYAPRYYAMSQENAAWTIQALLLRTPPPSQEFCYEIMQHNPELLDLLFQCASLRRPAWYPELQVDSIISESLALLFRVPPLLVPGIEAMVDDDFYKAAVNDWNFVLKSVKSLTARPNWQEKILKVWEMMEAERPHDIKNMCNQVKSLYFAQEPPDEESFLAIFQYRGSNRICAQRLIATITYSLSGNDMFDDALLSLLHITQQGCRPVPKTLEHITSRDQGYHWMESSFEVFRKPMSAVYTEEEVDPPLQLACETVLGPTAHARLLTVLAKSGFLDKGSRITKLPDVVSPRMTLQQLKQIISEDAIRRFLIFARERVLQRKEDGHKRFKKDGEMDYACVAYFTAAELAAAVIALDEATKKVYTVHIQGVRKELVLCLGNAAEMALGIGHHEQAICFAKPAVDIALTLPTNSKDSPDGIDKSITDKNLRRVERGRAGIAMS